MDKEDRNVQSQVIEEGQSDKKNKKKPSLIMTIIYILIIGFGIFYFLPYIFIWLEYKNPKATKMDSTILPGFSENKVVGLRNVPNQFDCNLGNYSWAVCYYKDNNYSNYRNEGSKNTCQASINVLTTGDADMLVEEDIKKHIANSSTTIVKKNGINWTFFRVDDSDSQYLFDGYHYYYASIQGVSVVYKIGANGNNNGKCL